MSMSEQVLSDLEQALAAYFDREARKPIEPVRPRGLIGYAVDTVVSPLLTAMTLGTGGAMLGIGFVLILRRKLDDLGDMPSSQKAQAFTTFVTGVLEWANEKKRSKSIECDDCDAYGYGYLVKDEVWEAATADEDADLLCLPCLEKRLDRPMRIADFPSVPINEPILHAFRLAQAAYDHRTH